ncbi:MAG: indole-3-glycerol phosphate synthase TrpC [Phycisphaerae bacterium]
MSTILDEILANKRKEVARTQSVVPLESVCARAHEAGACRDLRAALTAHSPHGIHLIAEVKHKSPSAGVIVEDFQPREIAMTYEASRASAVSVLTDREYFGGELEHLSIVKQAVKLPVLRKEFIVDEYQIFEARAAGADAILLIAEALGVEMVASLLPVAQSLGMTTLIECHEENNLRQLIDRIGPAGDTFLYGINNRDLKRQVTDIATTRQLASLLPEGTPFVTESGIRTRKDVQELIGMGATAMLVGEAILSHQPREAKIRELLGE